jgi:hypothetical protein
MGVAGGFIGFMGGMVAAMLWADMDLGSSEAPMLILTGTAVGAAGGAFIGAEIIS